MEDKKPIVSTRDFRFEEDVYVRLCDSAGKGQLEEMKTLIKEAIPYGARIGTTTFCPPPKYHLKSPLVEAAQKGHLNVVRYLLETYSDVIDINCGATIQTKIQKIYTHNVPPLIAASISGNLELVEYFVAQGADLHKLSLTRATPLRMASFYGYTDIMEYLIDRGVDINKANCTGSGPLLVAAHNGGPEAVKFLLEKGANVDQRNLEGYTAFHEACQRGKFEVVQLLLESNLSPLFATSSNFTDLDYITCPLYLAAGAGHSKIVSLLFDHKDCPLECKVNANLLLCTANMEHSIYEENVDFEEELAKTRELWLKALQMKEDHGIVIAYPLQRKEYGQRVEIDTKDQLESVWNTPEFLETELYIQCLLIRDRLLGVNDQSLIECLIRRGAYFSEQGWFKEAEGIWERGMQVEMHVSEVECSHPEYGYCGGVQSNIEGDLDDFVGALGLMYASQYVPSHDRYIQFGLAALTYLERLSNKADSEIINNKKILKLLLKIVYLKVRSCCNTATADGAPTASKLAKDPLIKELVAKHLFLVTDGDTLLHVAIDALQVLPFSEENFATLYLSANVCVYIEALLMAGADEAINTMSTFSGDMPIHRVAYYLDYHKELFQLLVNYGAHPDTVNREGKTMMGFFTKSVFYEALRGPLSLYCCVANAVVRYSLPYQSIGLPRHVVCYVDTHNSESIKITKDTYF